jgi:hypothetical protein
MKLFLALLAAGFVSGLVWNAPAGSKPGSPAQQVPTAATKSRAPVLVELFTSEGCSDCPPADALLAVMYRKQPFPTADVIAIEEHVDYWDQQGWRDPFSSSKWTQRQNGYSFVMHTGSSYTPQMVVDGTQGFIGSRGPAAKAAVEKAAENQKAKIEIGEVEPPTDKGVTLKIAVEKLPSTSPKDTAEVLLGITESGLHSAVSSGENAGHELQHSAVLRDMKVIGAAGKNGQDGFAGEEAVKLDAKWNLENLRAVVFVQEKKSRRVLGVAELHLKN